MTWYYAQKILNIPPKSYLELINEFGKVAGYKINTKKSLPFLFTNDKGSEREIKETIPFSIASKIVKITYLRTLKTCTLKTVRHWWKKSKITQRDGKIYQVLALEESVLSNEYTTQDNL